MRKRKYRMERYQIGGKQYRFRDYIARSADKSDRNRPPAVFDLTVVVHSDSSRCRPFGSSNDVQ